VGVAGRVSGQAWMSAVLDEPYWRARCGRCRCGDGRRRRGLGRVPRPHALGMGGRGSGRRTAPRQPPLAARCRVWQPVAPLDRLIGLQAGQKSSPAIGELLRFVRQRGLSGCRQRWPRVLQVDDWALLRSRADAVVSAGVVPTLAADERQVPLRGLD
jgi:hypothetical protein